MINFALLECRGFGDRLRKARVKNNLSAVQRVKAVNSIIVSKYGLKPININTYYAWEKIGIEGEVRNGKSMPHPRVLAYLSQRLKISLSWIFYSCESQDLGFDAHNSGKVKEDSSDLYSKLVTELTLLISLQSEEE